MAGSTFILFTFHAFLFSFIFWILTFLSKYLYSNKYYNYKLNFYECGFNSLRVIEVNYQIDFILLFLFLIIYDGEFLLLVPLSLQILIISYETAFLIIFFFIWLLVVLIIDYSWKTLDWHV